MTENYEITSVHEEWASKRKHGLSRSKLKELIKKQKGRCAMSGADMIFDKVHGNPNVNTQGCHPLYAAIDHISPSNDSHGYQIVCYDLNDLKGHLPYKIFKELQLTEAWKQLMSKWRSLAEEKDSINNRDGFKNLIRD